MGIDTLAATLFRNTARFGTFFGLKGYFNREDVRGLEHIDSAGQPVRPQIVAANHYGGKLDSVLIWTYLGRKVGDRAAFPAKKELFYPSLKFAGFDNAIMRAAGCIPVDRENPGTIIDELVKALEHRGAYDGVLSIHFEGKTTPKGVHVGKAKTGFARAALRLPAEHAPLVLPTSVGYEGGTYHTLPAFRSRAMLEFLAPIDVAPWKRQYGTYNPATGETPEQYKVCEDLTERVKGLVIDDLKQKGIKVAPGIPYGILG